MGLRLRLFRILSEPRCARGDLDFVFLDGDHRYSSVRRDLKVLVQDGCSGQLRLPSRIML